jgi:hypothetical protein
MGKKWQLRGGDTEKFKEVVFGIVEGLFHLKF